MVKHQVIIIGGGIAGLSSAVKLVENGIKDILLLEANNRLGEHSFIEIGAQWIHGSEGNPIYELNRKIKNINDIEVEADEMHYATQDGTEIEEEFAEAIIDEIHNEIDDLEDEIKKNANKQTSLGDYLKLILKKVIDEHGKSENNELIKAIFKSETDSERHESSCDNLNELSAIGWNSYNHFNGNEFVILKNGYIKLVEYLISKLPNGTVRLNEIVENINWSNKENIKLITTNGLDRNKQEFQASKVLCTIPLGYLKNNYMRLFSPELPSEKLRSIQKLGFGCVDKIFVVFDRDLFTSDFQGFQIFWRDDLDLQLESCNKWNIKNKSFYKEFTTFELLPNHRNVLFSFVVGEGAKFIENLEDECLHDIMYEILKKSFPKFVLPRPQKIIRSKWNNQPFTLGSYGYIRTGSGPEDMETLFEPLNGCVFFAGEATNSQYAGTVHGAFISGEKAADLIEDSLNSSMFDSSSEESSED